jgi:hypothetical protein
MDRDYHSSSEIFTLQESVELDRLRREGRERPPYADMVAIRAWLAEQRLRWAKEGHPDYQHILSEPGSGEP